MSTFDPRVVRDADRTVDAVRRHLVSVPAGAHLLSEAILRSPILAGDMGIPEGLEDVAGTSGAAGGAGGAQFEFGVDPSMDPELAMVRLSSIVTT